MKTLLLLFLLVVIAAAPAGAQVRYVDENGVAHWVQSYDQVPEKYRAKAGPQNLPTIGTSQKAAQPEDPTEEWDRLQEMHCNTMNFVRDGRLDQNARTECDEIYRENMRRRNERIRDELRRVGPR